MDKNLIPAHNQIDNIEFGILLQFPMKLLKAFSGRFLWEVFAFMSRLIALKVSQEMFQTMNIFEERFLDFIWQIPNSPKVNTVNEIIVVNSYCIFILLSDETKTVFNFCFEATNWRLPVFFLDTSLESRYWYRYFNFWDLYLETGIDVYLKNYSNIWFL